MPGRKTSGPLWPSLVVLAVVVAAGCTSGIGTEALNAQGQHSTGFAAAAGSPQPHGRTAKAAPGNSGFASCQPCHGNDFAGGISRVSCFTCHGVSAPHPRQPWRISGATDNTHTNTDEANAPACADCHLGGANSPHPHAPPALSPGCFNNTLCHAAAGAPHITGAAWRNPTSSAFHGIAAKTAPQGGLYYCQTCHGVPGTVQFDNGTTTTACSTASCHPNAKAHPTVWNPAPSPFPSYVASHRDSVNRTQACGICHNVTDNNVHTPGGPLNAPSCFAASYANPYSGLTPGCHFSGPSQPNHAVPFDNNAHYLALPGDFTSNCGNCHALLPPSPTGAPACSSCHTNAATVNPLTTKNCTSCHGNPPGSASGPYPNYSGAHAKHLALNAYAGSPVTCDTCHSGIGSRTSAHYAKAKTQVTPGDVAFVSPFPYTSRSGGASAFDNSTLLSCLNVSCHGGQATPNWRTAGSIVVNSQCTLCHAAGTAQYNGYSSGQHSRHLGLGALCTDCHDMTLGTPGALNHFAYLSTTAMEGPARDTFRHSVGPEVVIYSGGRCTGTCHIGGTSLTHNDAW